MIEDHRETVIGVFILLVLILGALVVGTVRKNLLFERAADPATLCRLHQPVATAVLVLVDSTDPLARENAPRFQELIKGIRDGLPRFGRLTIVPFDDDLARPLTPVFDVCSPGQRSEADARFEGAALLQATYDSRFGAPLEAAIDGLTLAKSAARSPIAEQIERAVGSPAWRGESRKLVILTDGLQNGAQSVYRSAVMDLPPPESRFLEGVHVEFIELGNPRDQALQTLHGRLAWKEWLEAAGAATVEINAVGFQTEEPRP